MDPLADIEARWDEHWGEHEAKPTKDESFFATYPYSYMNSLAHVGHGYTTLRNEVQVRWHRMQGKDALFPFGFHLTGTPIVAAAKRVEQGEESMMRILRGQRIPEERIAQFSDPAKWAEYFPNEWKKDAQRLGLMIDWRRSFITTELNPYYDAFIRWQYTRLHEMGYVREGSHPVIWCPEDNAVVSDHDRHEGEGVAVQTYTVVQFELENGDRLPCATLRPETVFGVTNVFVDPEATYRRLRTPHGTWVVLPEAAERLAYQFDEGDLEDLGEVTGESLVGQHAHLSVVDRDVPILPAGFIKAERGTGVVMSVPSDAPDDHQAVLDLQADPGRWAENDVVAGFLDTYEPIPIIDTPELGDLPAPAVVERLGVTSQQDRDKLEQAKDEVYKAGFYQGTMKPDLPVVGGEPVSEAKTDVARWLTDEGVGAEYHEPAGEVICRCLTPCVVKLVHGQWFLAYGDESWKARAREALAQCRIVPEEARVQFENTIEWLNDWACAREHGLGTRLPWDDKWVIESLSDSTIYMAYYTFNHLLEDKVPAEDVQGNLALFDHVLHGKGSPQDAARGDLTVERIEEMRKEFLHWYPLDFRNSGKDLVQNHLTFALFHHAALFPPEHWPKAISVNGWITVDGEKMSKSRGNFITLRDALEEYGTTAVRLALIYAGEGLDDANFERDFAQRARSRALTWLEHVTAEPEATRDGELTTPDQWLLTVLHDAVEETTAAMHENRLRTGLSRVLFDLPRAWNRYMRRVDAPHERCLNLYQGMAARLMAPFAPHIAEEAWDRLGRNGLVIDAPYPLARDVPSHPASRPAEALVDQVLEDLREVVKVTGTEPRVARLFTAAPWKRTALDEIVKLAGDGRVNPGQAIPACIKALPDRKKEVPKLAQQLVKLVNNAPEVQERAIVDDLQVLQAAVPYIAGQVGFDVEVHEEGSSDVDDGGRASRALPTRPAILLVD